MAADPPPGMAAIPGGLFTFGAGEAESRLVERVQRAFIDAARRTLGEDDAPQELEPLREAIAAELKAAGGEFKYDWRRGPQPDMSDPKIKRRVELTRARDKLALASQFPDWQGDERPAVAVEVEPFYMDTHEVTVAEYQAYCAATGKRMPWPYRSAQTGEAISGAFPEVTHRSFMDPRSPVTGVTWDEAKAYAEWAGKRLPTEVEWEYAARAGKQHVFAWGDGPWDGEQANLGSASLVEISPRYQVMLGHVQTDDGYVALAPVGSYEPNAFGLYDMTGNAAEWCDGSPWYREYLMEQLAGELPEDFVEPAADDHVRYGHTRDEFQPIRGGGYNYGEYDARITRRYGPPIMHGEPERGFRCVMDVDTWNDRREAE